ncbi:SUMF1/EgtB/PvdO family nonheme iron enzyme [uncultured Treponema sp.]|uniref:formylglycine-generating enzyme family protein n=1 Tax=uncultured Treponema sp. TaxID=162155 RepID=UPI002617BDBD|nr:SUMF1/EgtB/PvdO family nonheme iron enzyme [uncultured Treponema sp.]
MFNKYIKTIIILIIIIHFTANSDEKKIFLEIPEVEASIGNNIFKSKNNGFTGVSGEKLPEYFRKEHKVKLSAYKIEKYLVTNEQFLIFKNETGYKTKHELEKKSTIIYNGITPATKITFLDAVAYCQWYSDKYGAIYRLPTSAEWEYAALCNEKKLFPWGNNNKLIAETGTEQITNRSNYSVYEIDEDSSSLGLHNLMGGAEYTLDCDDETFYEKSPEINALCTISDNGSASSVTRGVLKYNDVQDYCGFGLYSLIPKNINSWRGDFYFRTVIDEGTIFNKNTEDECVYFLSIGNTINKTINVLEHPQVNAKYKVYQCESNTYILLKTTNDKYYRVFFQIYDKNILGNIEKFWISGWVNSNDIELSNKKFYEINSYE